MAASCRSMLSSYQRWPAFAALFNGLPAPRAVAVVAIRLKPIKISKSLWTTERC